MVNFKFANSTRRESTSRSSSTRTEGCLVPLEGSREGEEDVVLADICLFVFVWFGFVLFVFVLSTKFFCFFFCAKNCEKIISGKSLPAR